MPIQAVLERQRTLNKKSVFKLRKKSLDCGVVVNYSLKTKTSEGATRFLSGAADTKRTVAKKMINDEAC